MTLKLDLSERLGGTDRFTGSKVTLPYVVISFDAIVWHCAFRTRTAPVNTRHRVPT